MKSRAQGGASCAPKRWLRHRIAGWFVTLLIFNWFAVGAVQPVVKNVTEDETHPPKMGFIKHELLIENARQIQEQYRPRVDIPPDVTAPAQLERPDFAPTNAIASSGFNQSTIIAFMLLVGAGIFALKKFAPEITVSLGEQFGRSLQLPAIAADLSAKVRMEEELISKFVADLQLGKPLPGRSTGDSDGARQKGFFAEAKEILVSLQKLLREISQTTQTDDSSDRRKKLGGCRDQLGVLVKDKNLGEFLPAWQLVASLEGLLKQVSDNTNNFTPSTLRTIVGAVNLLDNMLRPGLPPDASLPAIRLLVVDDDLISRNALAFALKRVFGQPDLAADGPQALSLAAAKPYNLIFLDVQMPEMDGFETCLRIHQTEANHSTPVVFVTANDDYDARAKSVEAGGAELISKPFLTFEIIVKALTLTLRDRFENRSPKPASEIKPRTPASVPAKTSAIVPVTQSRPAEPGSAEESQALSLQVATNLTGLRELLREIIQTPEVAARRESLADFYLLIHTLTLNVNITPMRPVWQLSALLEALTSKLIEKPECQTPSMFNTIYTALELIEEMRARALPPDFTDNPPIRLLVIEADPVANRIVAGALQTAFERPDSAANATEALESARKTCYDAIFMGIRLPEMSGFELCAKMGEAAGDRGTPVIFVAGHENLELRAQSIACGGTDLLAKPFLPLEINVKALTFALNRRLRDSPHKNR